MQLRTWYIETVNITRSVRLASVLISLFHLSTCSPFLLNSDLLYVSVALLEFRMLLYREQNSPNWDKVHRYDKRFTRCSRIVGTGGSRISENSRFRSRRVDSASPFWTFFVHRVVLPVQWEEVALKQENQNSTVLPNLSRFPVTDCGNIQPKYHLLPRR